MQHILKTHEVKKIGVEDHEFLNSKLIPHLNISVIAWTCLKNVDGDKNLRNSLSPCRLWQGDFLYSAEMSFQIECSI